MSIKLLSAAWDLNIESTEKMVLMCLCDHANDEGVCWPSVATIGRKCSKSERTIQTALKWLSDNDYFRFKDTPGKGRTYRLNPRKICTPANSAPVQSTTDTPADSAPHPRKSRTLTTNEPSGTVNDEANASSARPKRDPVGAFIKPAWADEQVWADFLQNRKTKRLSNTETAYRRFLKDIAELADADWPPGRLLEAIVARGWGAAFNPRPKDYGNGNRNANWSPAAGHRGSPDRREGFTRAIHDDLERVGSIPASEEAGRSDTGAGGGDRGSLLAGPDTLR